MQSTDTNIKLLAVLPKSRRSGSLDDPKLLHRKDCHPTVCVSDAPVLRIRGV